MVSGQFLGATALVVLMGSLMLPQAASGQGAITSAGRSLAASTAPRLMIAQTNGGFVITYPFSSSAPTSSPPIPLGQSVHLDRRLVDGLPQARSIRHAPSEFTHDPR